MIINTNDTIYIGTKTLESLYDQKETINNLAKKIASKSAMTLKIGKKAFYEQSKLDLEQAYQFTSEVMLDNMLKDDAKEGINAFIEKRDPEWKDK